MMCCEISEHEAGKGGTGKFSLLEPPLKSSADGVTITSREIAALIRNLWEEVSRFDLDVTGS